MTGPVSLRELQEIYRKSDEAYTESRRVMSELFDIRRTLSLVIERLDGNEEA